MLCTKKIKKPSISSKNSLSHPLAKSNYALIVIDRGKKKLVFDQLISFTSRQ